MPESALRGSAGLCRNIKECLSWLTASNLTLTFFSLASIASSPIRAVRSLRRRSFKAAPVRRAKSLPKRCSSSAERLRFASSCSCNSYAHNSRRLKIAAWNSVIKASAHQKTPPGRPTWEGCGNAFWTANRTVGRMVSCTAKTNTPRIACAQQCASRSRKQRQLVESVGKHKASS